MVTSIRSLTFGLVTTGGEEGHESELACSGGRNHGVRAQRTSGVRGRDLEVPERARGLHRSSVGALQHGSDGPGGVTRRGSEREPPPPGGNRPARPPPSRPRPSPGG